MVHCTWMCSIHYAQGERRFPGTKTRGHESRIQCNGAMTTVTFRRSVTDKPQRVTIRPLTMTCGSAAADNARAGKDTLKPAPGLLWSEHEIVKSSNPAEIELKVDMTPPYRPRCPLKPEADVHVSNRIEGPLQTAVLPETCHTCNAPSSTNVRYFLPESGNRV